MPAHVTPGVIAEFVFRGRGVRFFVRNILEIIQNAHLNGRFYEEDHLAVLAGPEQTIATRGPAMFIEVDNEKEPAFEAWLAGHDYELAYAFPRYRNRNFVVRPRASGVSGEAQ